MPCAFLFMPLVVTQVSQVEIYLYKVVDCWAHVRHSETFGRRSSDASTAGSFDSFYDT